MEKQRMTAGEVDELLARVLVGRLGTCSNNQPYVAPLCFVYYHDKIYFHSASQGRKIAYMKANPNVCFQVDEHRLVSSSKPCDFSVQYRSVIAFGQVRFLTSSKDKLEILRMMVRKYGGATIARSLVHSMVRGVEVGEIVVKELTGRKNE